VSDMTEIEKAIDEFERAVTDVADHNWYHDIVPTMLERLISKRDAKRERLLELINVDALNQRIAELQACIAKLDAYIIQVLRLLNNIECEYNGQVPYDELKPSLATIYKLLKEADNVSKIQRSND